MSDTNPSLKPSEHDLYARLGEQLAEPRELAAAEYGVESLRPSGRESLADFAAIGEDYFKRISQAAYKAICEGSPSWKTIQDKTESALVTVFTGLLLAHLAILAPVAAAVATLIVGIFFDAGKGELCDQWKASLPAAS